MQKGNLLLFVASLGIVWEHASSTSAGYCCPQITVALGTEDDGTYNFLAEGKGPAMKECQDACIYSKDSNETDLYCFEAVTTEALGNGQVQCEAISPYSLTSTTPAVTGPTTDELLDEIKGLHKVVDQLNDLLKKEVGEIKTEVNSIDGRLNKAEKKDAVCGYKGDLLSSISTTLIFDRVYEEVVSSSGGETLQKNGSFTAGESGVYLVTLETSVTLHKDEQLVGYLKLSSGNYKDDGRFIRTGRSLVSGSGYILDQASASRYVKMTAGETLHITLYPTGSVHVWDTTMCVSLYSASG